MKRREHVRSAERSAGFAVALVSSLVLLWGTRCGRVEAGSVADGLDRWASRVTATSGLPVRAARELGGVVTFRIGAMEGPAAAVLVDADRAVRGEGSVGQLAWRAARVGLDPRRVAILAVVIPVKDRADARGRSDVSARNFPWRWEEARRAYGAGAGVIPCELPWVAGVSDALLRSPAIIGVVDARDPGPRGAADGPDGPGTLRGLVEGRIGAPYARDRTAEAALQLAIDMPRARIHGEAWRRVGPRTWVVDFAVDGGEATENASATEAQPSAPFDLTLQLRAVDSRARIAAFATAEGPGEALEIAPLRRGRTRVGMPPAGAPRRCRAVLVMAEGARGGPSLTVEARSNRLVGASLRMAPTTASSPVFEQETPSDRALSASGAGTTK